MPDGSEVRQSVYLKSYLFFDNVDVSHLSPEIVCEITFGISRCSVHFEWILDEVVDAVDRQGVIHSSLVCVIRGIISQKGRIC